MMACSGNETEKITYFDMSENDLLPTYNQHKATSVMFENITLQSDFFKVMRKHKTYVNQLKRRSLRNEILMASPELEVWTTDRQTVERILIRWNHKKLKGFTKQLMESETHEQFRSRLFEYFDEPDYFYDGSYKKENKNIFDSFSYYYDTGFCFQYLEIYGKSSKVNRFDTNIQILPPDTYKEEVNELKKYGN